MSYVTGIILSNDCSDYQLEQLRKIYGLFWEEINYPDINRQLKKNQSFYLLNGGSYFWDNWTPIGRNKWIERMKKNSLDNFEENTLKILTIQEQEFDLKYITFEAQMYIIILKYLKLVYKVQQVGLVGFMLNGNGLAIPEFDKITVQLESLDAEFFYSMEENCVYYFE